MAGGGAKLCCRGGSVRAWRMPAIKERDRLGARLLKGLPPLATRPELNVGGLVCRLV
jgi:hypothetical protein